MTPAERCDLCSGCRTIQECRRRCAPIEPGRSAHCPVPASRSRRALTRTIDGAAILILFALTAGCLGLAGAFP